MPQIPQYLSQVSAPGVVQTRRATAAEFGAGEAQAVGQLGQAAVSLGGPLAELQVKKAAREATAYASRTIPQIQLDAQNKLRELETTDNIDTYSEQFQEYYKERLDAAAEEAPNEFAKSALMQKGAEIGLRLTGTADAFQANTKIKLQKADSATGIGTIVNSLTLDPDNFEDYKLQAQEIVAGASRYMTADEHGVFASSSADSIASAKVSAEINRNPQAAKELLAQDEFKNAINPAKYEKLTAQADNEIENAKKDAEKSLIQAKEASVVVQLQNQDAYMDLIADETKGSDEKLAALNMADLNGEIRSEFAVEARRYIKSLKSINTATNANVMAGIVTRMHDLNTIADVSQKDYLIGVENVRKEILKRSATGQLTKDDEKKLTNQMKTLTSAKVADATNQISYSFGEANKLIKAQLPPELRGEATRRLFYATEGEQAEAEVKKTGQDLKNYYKEQATKIVDDIQIQRRGAAIQNVNRVLRPAEQVVSNADFLASKGYTQEDLQETANKYNLTVEEVMQRLRAQ
jgi:hypothetical protein